MAIESVVRRSRDAARVLHLTPWFALFGAIVALANLLIGNHITVVFWIATWALPGLVLDFSRMLTGSRAWQPAEGWWTWRTVAAIVIVVAIAAPFELVLDGLGGYEPANALVNTDWSQLSDAIAVSVAVAIAREFLQLTKPKKESEANRAG